MEITKEFLENQKEVFSQELEKIMQMFNRIQGAIAHCDALIYELETPVVEEKNLKILPGPGRIVLDED